MVSKLFFYTVQFGIRVFFPVSPPFRNLSFFSPHHEYISIDRSIDWSFDVMSMNSEKFIFFFFKCPQQWNWIKRKMKFHCSNFRVFNLSYSKKAVTVIIIIILNVDSRYSNWCYLFYQENSTISNNKIRISSSEQKQQQNKNIDDDWTIFSFFFDVFHLIILILIQ